MRQQLTNSACRNLVSLARNDKEKILFEKIGRIYGGLTIPMFEQTRVDLGSAEQRKLIAIVQMFQQEDFAQATVEWGRWPSPNSIPANWSQLFKKLTRRQKLFELDLLALIEIELELSGAEDSDRSTSPKSAGWIAHRTARNSLKLDKLENLFEIDFQATHLVKGRWIRGSASEKRAAPTGN